MQLQTTRFGALDVDPDRVITFTQPILGFQDYRRFVLVSGPEGGTLNWLQSTESGELAFILMNPREVVPDYSVTLTRQDLAELAATAVGELDVYTLVVVPQDPTQIRTNLRAPIVINRKRQLAKQAIQEDSAHPIQFFLAPGKRAEGQAGEVSNARVDA